MVSRRDLFELRVPGDFRFVFDHRYIQGIALVWWEHHVSNDEVDRRVLDAGGFPLTEVVSVNGLRWFWHRLVLPAFLVFGGEWVGEQTRIVVCWEPVWCISYVYNTKFNGNQCLVETEKLSLFSPFVFVSVVLVVILLFVFGQFSGRSS